MNQTQELRSNNGNHNGNHNGHHPLVAQGGKPAQAGRTPRKPKASSLAAPTKQGRRVPRVAAKAPPLPVPVPKVSVDAATILDHVAASPEPEVHSSEPPALIEDHPQADAVLRRVADPAAEASEHVLEPGTRMEFHGYQNESVVYKTASPFATSWNGSAFRDAYGESFREAYEESLREAASDPDGVQAAGEEFPHAPAGDADAAASDLVAAPPPASSQLVSAPAQRRGFFAGLTHAVAGSSARLWAALGSARDWYLRRASAQGGERMRLIESISLGEKRFIGVIQVDGCEFLVGGGADSVAVLAQLGAPSVPAPGSSAYAAIASCSSEPQA